MDSSVSELRIRGPRLLASLLHLITWRHARLAGLEHLHLWAAAHQPLALYLDDLRGSSLLSISSLSGELNIALHTDLDF